MIYAAIQNRLSIVLMLFMGLSLFSHRGLSQCQSYIKVDGLMINANQLAANGLHLPFWLKEGQTLAADQMVNSVSVVEFTVTPENTLEFSAVKSVTSVQTVPSGKAWKVESILKTTSSLSEQNGALFSNGGTYSFTVPSCASYICIELWGGGGGGRASTSGGGGGGGAYGQGCYSVTPSSTLSVVVGAGGIFGNPPTDGGTSSVTGPGVNISASGGLGGGNPTGGAGGNTVVATVIVPGGNGGNGVNLSNPYYGGAGGAAGGSPVSPGGMGGSGGVYAASVGTPSTLGGFPGGGGGGQATGAGTSSKGAEGKVVITW